MASGGAVDCLDCTPGKYQDAVKSTMCKDCDAGQYQNEDGTQACVDCGKGKTMASGGAVDCLDSDHRAIFIKVRICRNLAKPKQAKSGRVSCDMLQDPIVRPRRSRDGAETEPE